MSSVAESCIASKEHFYSFSLYQLPNNFSVCLLAVVPQHPFGMGPLVASPLDSSTYAVNPLTAPSEGDLLLSSSH